MGTGFAQGPPSNLSLLISTLVGGFFTSFQPNGALSSTTRNQIARLNPDGTLDTGFDPNASSRVRSIAVQPDGKIVIGGDFIFLQPNGAPSPTFIRRIARLNANGTIDPSIDYFVGGNVLCVALQADGKILLGGLFSSLQANGAPSATTRNRIARLNADKIHGDRLPPPHAIWRDDFEEFGPDRWTETDPAWEFTGTGYLRQNFRLPKTVQECNIYGVSRRALP